MYVPHGPLWCWTLFAGEDGQYFSQPPTYWHDQQMHIFRGDGACIARCQITPWVEEPDASHRTYPIQCGQLARLTPDGGHACEYHLRALWTCRHCGTMLDDETDAWCSAACQAADAAQPDPAPEEEW